MSEFPIQSGGIVIVEQDFSNSRFIVDQVGPERITMHLEHRPDVNKAIIKVDGQWKVQMAEDTDYTISFEAHPFNMTDFPPRPLNIADEIVIRLDGDDNVTIFGVVDRVENCLIELNVNCVDFSFTVIEDLGIKDGDGITLKYIGGEWTIEGHSDRKYMFDLQDYSHGKLTPFSQKYIYQIFVVEAPRPQFKNILDMMMNSGRSYPNIEGVLDYVKTFLYNMVKDETEGYEEGENGNLFGFFEDFIQRKSLDVDNIEEFLPKFIRDLSINMTTESNSRLRNVRESLQIFRTPFDSGPGTKSSEKRS